MFVEVILDQGIDRPLDYSVPKELSLQVGQRVEVPIRNRLVSGTVFKIKESSLTSAKPVASCLSDEPVLTPELFQLANFLSLYWCTPLRKVLKIMVPQGVKKNTQIRKTIYYKRKASKTKLAEAAATLRNRAPKQAAALDLFLQSDIPLTAKEYPDYQPAFKALTEKKFLEKIEILPSPVNEFEYFPVQPKKLTPEQLKATQNITDSINNKKFSVKLLHGVTGSGKSEVYFQAIQTAFDKGLGVLFLAPEIALASQLIETLKTRFKESIAVLHHRLTDGERKKEWQALLKGEKTLSVGARSAVFSPIKNLGLIIVDEEHEASYKQEDDMPCYHARDLAVFRAKLNQIPIVLGSATPSLESYTNALQKKYELITLKNRASLHPLPKVTIINMTEDKQQNPLFSDELLSALKKRIEKGEQTILFLNRRGYHTSIFCKKCQEFIKCSHCDTTLTHHKESFALLCHLCGHKQPHTKWCPSCKEATLQHKGMGTQQVEKVLQAILGEVRVIRMDADSTKEKDSHQKLLREFSSGKADVLVGTQMVIKGLNFPQVTLVGILNADHLLHLPDFRATEVTFQQITQVAGRAGRGVTSGEVILQTNLPNHLAISSGANQDYNTFFKEESESRKLFGYPPYKKMVRIIIKGKQEMQTKTFAEKLRLLCIQQLPKEFEILPLLPCGVPKINDFFRFFFLLKGDSFAPFAHWIKRQPLPKNSYIHWKIDVDPLTTYF